jgi:hypothetical protein
MCSPGWIRALLTACALALLPVAARAASAAREILATGDLVERLGHIGYDNFAVHGIDNRGRMVVSDVLTTGHGVIARVGGSRPEILWTSPADQPYGATVHDEVAAVPTSSGRGGARARWMPAAACSDADEVRSDSGRRAGAH